jgi:Raf kinase inhibitor-like YbhB/YbcL family protein
MQRNTLTLRSPAFAHGERIPSVYTCDGKNVSPPLAIDNIPSDTKSLTLIVEDPDVPQYVREDGVWVHWVVYNMPPDTSRIAEEMDTCGVQGLTTKGVCAYGGPCPPDREHRYLFTVYALSEMLPLQSGATKEQVLRAQEGLVLQHAVLMGRYARIGNSAQ